MRQRKTDTTATVIHPLPGPGVVARSQGARATAHRAVARSVDLTGWSRELLDRVGATGVGDRRASHFAYLHGELSDERVAALVRRDGSASGHRRWLRLAERLMPSSRPTVGVPASVDPLRTVLSLTRSCDHLETLHLLRAGSRGVYPEGNAVAAMSTDPWRPLVVHEEERGDVHVLRLSGELDVATVPLVRDKLRSVSCSTLRVDLAELTFCDASGVTTLITTKRARAQEGCPVRIVGASGLVRRVFVITGLDGELDD